MSAAHFATDRVREVRLLLSDPADVCRRLGLDEGARRHGRGVHIRCPWHHPDRRPSCSVFRGEDGTIGVRCFSCGATGDVFYLVAAARGLDLRVDFARVLREATDLAGARTIAGFAGVSGQNRPSPAAGAVNAKTPSWPSVAQVRDVWSSACPVTDSPEVSAWLQRRGLNPGDVEGALLVRALPAGLRLPGWARCNRRSWWGAGYRCIVPMIDETGSLRSLRARQVLPDQPDDAPKAAPPAGYNVAGLVMADALARQILATGRAPSSWPPSAPLRIIFTEGEPDFFTWAVASSGADVTAPAVFGVVNGCWTSGLAARIPDGARVILATHHDGQGERYAREIYESIGARCTILRAGSRGCGLCPSFGWSRGLS
jgi:hypothetical protein